MSSFCFFILSKNNFLMSCLKVLTDLRNFVSAAIPCIWSKIGNGFLAEAALSKG